MCDFGIKGKFAESVPRYLNVWWLKKHGANCKDGIEWFEKHFPEGEETSLVLARCTNPSWISWFLNTIS